MHYQLPIKQTSGLREYLVIFVGRSAHVLRAAFVSNEIGVRAIGAGLEPNTNLHGSLLIVGQCMHAIVAIAESVAQEQRTAE